MSDILNLEMPLPMADRPRYHRAFWIKEEPGKLQVWASSTPRQDRACRREGYRRTSLTELRRAYRSAYNAVRGASRHRYYAQTWSPDRRRPCI